MKKLSKRNHSHLFSSFYQLNNEVLYLIEAFTLSTVDQILPHLLNMLQRYHHQALTINLDQLERLDSAGVATLDLITRKMSARGIQVTIEGGSGAIRGILKTFTVQVPPGIQKREEASLLEMLGAKTYEFLSSSLKDFFFLISDIFYWSVVDLFRPKTYRKGEFVNQAVLIGVKALGIVGGLSFLIGLVLALQSVAQLRQFGADRFIVDLIVIAMMREMGPLITAVIVAGRSGSAIASEIATMKVTEELDALTTMALDPLRFVVVPKLYASLFTMPFLTIMASVFGIAGGIVVAFIYLDITPVFFLSRTEEVLLFRDIVTGLIKSLVFAGIIVLTGSFFGFRVKRGSSDVGRVTTSAVVVSISLVILADSILGLIFY